MVAPALRIIGHCTCGAPFEAEASPEPFGLDCIHMVIKQQGCKHPDPLFVALEHFEYIATAVGSEDLPCFGNNGTWGSFAAAYPN